MAFRSSLRGCIAKIGSLFAGSGERYLSIVRIPNGKYYTVLTDSELAERPVTTEDGEARLVFRGTLRELKEFAFPPQPDLFATYPGIETVRSGAANAAPDPPADNNP